MRRWSSIALALAASCAAIREPAPAAETEAYELAIEGATAFPAQELRAAIAAELETLAEERTKAAVDDAAWAVREYYLEAGFLRVAVDYEWEPLDDGRVRARLIVREGPRTAVESVTFEGAASFPESLLAASFSGPTDGLSGAGFWYVERRVREARSDLQRFYRQEGFLGAVVAEPRVAVAEDGRSAAVTFTIGEGPRYVLAPPVFEGDPERATQLAQLAAGTVGQPVGPRAPHQLRARIVDWYTRRGWPDVEVEFEAREVREGEDGLVRVVFEIDPGDRVQIARVRIEGNEKTDEAFIRSALTMKKGDRYDSGAVRESFLALYRTGIFRGVDIDLEGQGTERGLVVRVEELPTVEVYVEPGWGSYERLRFRAGWRDRNIWGSGRALAADATLSFLYQSLILSLTDPRFLNSDYQMAYSLFGLQREEPAFTTTAIGAGATLSRRWNERWKSALGYQYELSTLDDADSPLIPEAASDVDISSVTLTNVRDTRDGLILATDGNLSRLVVEVADQTIGSQLDFVRFRWTQSSFLPLRDGTVLAGSYRGGIIAPTSGQVIPAQQRFYNGGENTVRSFKQDELGPKDPGGNPLGGEAFNVFSVELRQRIVGKLDGAGFVDAGNVPFQAEDWWRLDDYSFGIGGGLRYLLPVGPLRLDWAWNPDPGGFDEDWVLHFSVGMAF